MSRQDAATDAPRTVYDFTVKNAQDEDVSLKAYAGQVLLLVNVASKCGFTKQYEGLEALYQAHHEDGFVVLGFPCNQFGGQEPGSNAEIQEFCQLNFGVTFPVLAKIDVNGDSAHPLYVFLKKQAPGLMGTEAIKWNFTKFLVDRNGKVVQRFGSRTKPKELEGAIRELLAADQPGG